MLKRVPILVLVTALIASIATVAYAWQVYYNGLANVTLTVRQAEAEVEVVDIDIGEVGSGYYFGATGWTTVTTTGATGLIATVTTETLTLEEAGALEGCVVWVGEDLNGDGTADPEEYWGGGSMNVLTQTPPSIISPPLDEGTHSIFVLVAGFAAYPETPIAIDFSVFISIDTP